MRVYTNLSVDKISSKISRITGKLDILRKKQQRWGLTEEDNKQLLKLMLEYNQNYFQLIDNVFNDYVEPFIYNDAILDLKSELMDKYGWDGNMLCFDKELSDLFSTVNSKKDLSVLLGLVKRLKEEELKTSMEFEKSDSGKETKKLFSEIRNCKEENCIYDYISGRYDIMINVLEGAINE